MGNEDRERSRREDKKAAASAARKRRSTPVGANGPADWASCDGTLLTKAVSAIARDGGALRLGYTRDGGAYALGIYGDGDPFTEYVSPNDDIDEFLKGLIEDYGR